MKISKTDWLIVIAILLLSILIVGFASDFNLTGEVDINLHDSYIVVSKWVLMLVIFVSVGWIIFLVKSIKEKFKQKSSNILFLFKNALMIFMMCYLVCLFLAIVAVNGLLNFLHLKDPISISEFAFYFFQILMSIIILLMLAMEIMEFRKTLKMKNHLS